MFRIDVSLRSTSRKIDCDCCDDDGCNSDCDSGDVFYVDDEGCYGDGVWWLPECLIGGDGDCDGGDDVMRD
ncbi:hypothetical protein Tco_0811270 [Tanacetum coccineum]